VRGGHEKLREAGCALLGGHSVRDAEIKFGYAVTGLVDPERMLTNAGGRPGDVLVLTKPLGTGVIATALKAGSAPEPAVQAATLSMSTLNAAAAAAALRHAAHAATDITGFGLAGHAAGIARESRLTIEIEAEALPVLPHALELAPSFQPGGLKANRAHFEPRLSYGGPLDESRRALLFDPQTSGGLLLLFEEAAASAALRELPEARRIGRAAAGSATALRIV
jgi:selenide,water dikinase